MESKPVAVLMALIVLIAAGAVVYYWMRGQEEVPVSGVVVEKFQREAGTEAGDQPIAQGLRVLTGDSTQQEMFYFLRVRTAGGELVEMEVPQGFFMQVKIGDTVQRISAESAPTIAQRGGGRP
jgi:hypothetical protein